MRIMAERMNRGRAMEFETFLSANQDLVDDCVGVLARHYSEGLLNSDSARAGWVEPDRLPLKQ
jgi:hypothetical protein